MAIINPHYNQMFGQSAEYDGLKFTAVDAGAKVTYSVVGTVDTSGIQKSTDGVTWTSWAGGDSEAVIFENAGDYIYVKNTNNTLSTSTSNYVTFFMAIGRISASGNTNSMINFSELTDFCFYSLFIRTNGKLISASELPATTLKPYCYAYMFTSCTGLTSAPVLPAETLASHCYDNMFKSCTGLTSIPELPANSLQDYCYYHMFNGCNGLTTITLPAYTSLSNNCCAYMFKSCTGLTSATLLSTTQSLAYDCYRGMFLNSLALNSISLAYSGDLSSSYFYDWVNGVAASGTFAYNGPTTLHSKNTIPSGWTVVPYPPSW